MNAMKRLIVGSLLFGSLLLAPIAGAGAADHASASKAPSAAAAKLHQDLRTLWSDHVIWTRDYIVAAVGDQPDQQAAATRLLQNQKDIGGAVATYYGKAAGDQLTKLLEEHITIAVDLIKA